MALQVNEASEAYERAMRNIVAAGPGICRVCWTFMNPDFETCLSCDRQPDCLDAMVPITYSEHLGQMHLGGTSETRQSASPCQMSGAGI